MILWTRQNRYRIVNSQVSVSEILNFMDRSQSMHNIYIYIYDIIYIFPNCNLSTWLIAN